MADLAAHLVQRLRYDGTFVVAAAATVTPVGFAPFNRQE
jgi:hypothetical protein